MDGSTVPTESKKKHRCWTDAAATGESRRRAFVGCRVRGIGAPEGTPDKRQTNTRACKPAQREAGKRVRRIRPGSAITKEPDNRSPSSSTSLTTSRPIEERAAEGYRSSTHPTTRLPPTNDNRPKSLSSVMTVRPSVAARAITSRSVTPACPSAIAAMSWPAARSARTTATSQLSSARNRIDAARQLSVPVG